MKYEVLTYGNPTLRKKSVRVAKVDESIRKLAKDMLAAMYRANGLGLAAEQVGRTEAVCVIDVPPDVDKTVENGPRDNPDVSMPLVLINPQLVREEGAQTSQEGCLSFPEIFVNIKRAFEVTVTYLGTDNRQKETTVRGLAARAVLHEMDHLDGILLVDRMSTVQKLAVAGKLKRLKKATQEKEQAKE